MRPPAEELSLPDGTRLTLHQAVSLTMETGERMTGDWLIAQEPQAPRAVVFIFDEGGRQTAKMVYDTHTLKHGSAPAEPPPEEKLKYELYNIDSKVTEEKYLEFRRMFEV